MDFRVLGPLEVRSDGAVLPVRAPTQRALLATLLLSPNQVVTCKRLVDALWGQTPPPSALANLRSHVAALRRLLSVENGGDTRLVTRSGGYLIVVQPGELDLAVFGDLVDQGKQAAQQDRHAIAAGRFGQALRLWHGEPLDNVTLSGSGGAEVTRLGEARLAVVEDCLRARLSCGEHADVISELRGLAGAHPLREPFWALLMLALHRAGRQADALAAYDQVRTHLADELGLDPGHELRQLHQRILTDDPSLTPSAVPVSRCDLPCDIRDFAGRETELRQLLAAVRAHHHGDGALAVVISAIDGMAGIGKTALAVRLAHHLTPQYPDGQLFVDLCGHTPGHQPLSAAAALDKLLRAAGVPGERIPADVVDRAALWRATLAGRRTLIVLDNAADSAQVRPLLPGTPGCLVLVTSRRRLTDVDGTHLLSLDVLPPEDAVTLFEQVVGDTRPPAEPEAVTEVLALCGYLPLAIRIAAARLRHRTSWTVVHLASRLRDQQRLAELQGETRSVTVAFALSYQYLTADQQRLFRLLGLHPGPDIDPCAVAALADLSIPQSEDLLEELIDAHLLQQPTAGRYRFHDLLRAYAACLAHSEETDADRRAALTRLFDHYLHTASAATELVMPAGSRPRSVSSERASALSWLETERPNLLAAAAHTADHQWPTHICGFSTILARYVSFRTYHDDALALHNQALTISLHHGHRSGQSAALHRLGRGYWSLSRHDDALDCYQQALTLARATGDRVVLGHALHGLGLTYGRLGRYREAVEHAEQALVVVRGTGDRIVEGYVLHGLSIAHWGLGRYQDAIDHAAQALILARAVGDRIVEGYALQCLGLTYRMQGRHDDALDCYQQALTIARHIDEPILEAQALNGLGELTCSTVSPSHAFRLHQQALTIAEQIREPRPVVN